MRSDGVVLIRRGIGIESRWTAAALRLGQVPRAIKHKQR
jgi:hypothetical protein